jgi:hypothetical protein
MDIEKGIVHAPKGLANDQGITRKPEKARSFNLLNKS